MVVKRTGRIKVKRSPNNPTPQQREAVWVRSGGCCERCGRGLFNCIPTWHAHHRQLRQSGNNILENLAALCPECHRLAHSRPLNFGMPQGWIVSRYSDPTAVPILHWQHGRVLLTPNGYAAPTPVAAPVGVPVDEERPDAGL